MKSTSWKAFNKIVFIGTITSCVFIKGCVWKGNEMNRNLLSHCTFLERVWRKEEEMWLGSRLIQPPGKKGSFRWLIFRCYCIAPWHQLGAAAEHQTGRTHSICTNTSLLQGTSPFCKTGCGTKRTASGKILAAAHIYRESIMWWPWDSTSNMRNSCGLPYFFSSFLPSCVSLFIVRPMKSINYPSLQSYWKGSEKNRGRWEQQIPFLFPS